MAYRIRVEGIKNTRGALNRTLNVRFKRAAIIVVQELKKYAPVITGRLQMGYRSNRANSAGFDVINRVPYANINFEHNPEPVNQALASAERRIQTLFNQKVNI